MTNNNHKRPGRLTRGRGWRPNAPRPIDTTRKEAFLRELAEHGIVGEAARVASPHSHRGCLQTFYRERDRDPEFAQAWDEALDLAKASVETELHRRAVKGVDEPVFYKGEECGHVKKYSDALLLAMMRKLDPAYRQVHKLEHAGSVDVKPIGLDQLNKVQRALLRQLLVTSAKDAEFSVVATPSDQDDQDSTAPALSDGPEIEGYDDAEEPQP